MARSRSIGGIYASLTLRDGGFRKGITAARKELNAFGNQALKGIAIGIAAATTATAVLAKKTLSLAGELDDARVNTGLQISEMVQLRKEFELGGVAAGNVGKDIGRMQKTIAAAAGGGKDPFAAMGLSAANLLAMDPAGQFRTIGASLLRIQNPAERTAKAMEIFGKSGAGLINVFGQAEDAAKFLGQMPAVFGRYAGAMGRADDLINEIPGKYQQFFVGFTGGIIGTVLPAMEKIAAYDFTPLGTRLGSAYATGLQVLTDGTVWDIFQLQGEKALTTIQSGTAFNGLAASINAVLDFGATGEWDFSKYLNAGLEGNIERIDDLQDRIDALNKGIGQKYQAAQDAAAAIGGNALPSASPPLPASPSAPVITPPSTSFAEATRVNDYQRRGLSLDGAAVASPEEKSQTRLLTEARDLLQKIANSREPHTW